VQAIPQWRAGRAQSSLDRRTLLDYRGQPLAEVHQAPALMVGRVAAELRRAAPAADENPALLWRAIQRAGALLTQGSPGGWSAAEHARLITLSTGAPIRWTREAVAELGAGLQAIEGALRWQAPGGDLTAYAEHRVVHSDGRGYAWAPRGRVLGFVAPSNHPAVHLTWVMALAMGWSVLLRPGADDPFTPWRVVQALAEAGFPPDRVALLAGEHDQVPILVDATDRTVAYGGEALGALLGRDRRVLFNGPGRSKVLVDGPAPPEQVGPFLLDCVLHDGGRKCTCTSSVIVRGEGHGLCEALRTELRGLPLLDPLDPGARVPAWKGATAGAGLPGSWVNHDGLTFLQPDLVLCPDPTAPPFGVELPAPWATAAEIPAGADPLPLLRQSQAVTLLSRDRRLRARCLQEPGILKVFTGLIPTWHSEPGAPHHGRLADFLFTAKFAPEEALPWT
jgi:acyl-CoA reductase-like NAD-dependent aldehyde dehydrogenase